MTLTEAKQIIEVLVSGVDPATGEVLPEDNPLNSPHVIRALVMASNALGRAATLPWRKGSAPPGMSGKAWSEDEDKRLLVGFDAGTPVAALAHAHERTRGAITSRLERLGRLKMR